MQMLIFQRPASESLEKSRLARLTLIAVVYKIYNSLSFAALLSITLKSTSNTLRSRMASAIGEQESKRVLWFEAPCHTFERIDFV